MIKITSVNNDLVKETAKLLKGKYREETGLFLIEGEKGVTEAITAGVKVERVFVADKEMIKTYQKYDIDFIETTEAVLSKISDVKTSPKLVAVARQQKPDFERLKNAKKVVLLEGIKDAGNLGTILRTAAAFGIDAIVLFGDVVDLYNPKTVRSAVGNLWKIPIFKMNTKLELDKYFNNYERCATLPTGIGVIPLKDYKPEDKVLMMFGSEADGLSEDLKEYATKNITIEMQGEVESLNLAVSASIIMYKLV